MSSKGPAAEEITRHLHEAIDRPRIDLVKVELWAAALRCFQRPIPNYEPSDKMLLPPSKPAGAAKSKR
jgi:hypothetical protein